MPEKISTVVVRTPGDRTAYAHLLHRQRRWLERELGMAIADLQRSAVAEYDDPLGHYALSGTVALLTRVGGTPAGIAALRPLAPGDPGEVELKRVFVQPEHRGRGLGRRLVEDALTVARRLGARRVVLESHEGHMPRAVALYRSLGFVAAPRLGLTTAPGTLTLAVEP